MPSSKQRAPDYGPLAEAMEKAAQLEYEAAQQAIALWRETYAQQRLDLGPYRAAGPPAMDRLYGGYGMPKPSITAKQEYAREKRAEADRLRREAGDYVMPSKGGVV